MNKDTGIVACFGVKAAVYIGSGEGQFFMLMFFMLMFFMLMSFMAVIHVMFMASAAHRGTS